MRIPWFDINPARLHKVFEQTGRVLSYVFLAGLLVVPFVWFVWFAFFTTTFTVQAITIVDAREHTAQAVEQLLQGKIGRNIFWLNTATLEEKIVLTVPQVRAVHIVRKLPATLKIVVQEKQPAILLLSQKTYYFVDDTGIAYESASLDTLPGVVLPVVKNNDQGGSTTVGSPVVEASFITFIARIQKELPTITSAQVVEIRIPSLAAREVHFHLNNNWLIRFDISRSADGQLQVLKKLLTTTIPVDAQAGLEYIDLRIPQRVYYKIKGSNE